MRRTARLATGAVVLGVVSLAGAPAASAVVCSTYAQSCEEAAVVQDRSVTRGSVGGTSTTPNTLPFTGGETVLLGLAGIGAVAAGTALVAATRRRAVTPA